MNSSKLGWIVQRVEDHPTRPGWWRFGRPYWVANESDLPATGFPESVRWALGSRDELQASQAAWDKANA